MTVNQFRRIALGMRDVIEASHMGHPDFRVNGRIFATLGYPDRKWGALMLTPDQQQGCLHANPVAFVPAAGAWGRAGSTIVQLDSVDESMLGEAMTLAWQNAVQKAKPRTRTTESRTRTKNKRT